MRNTPVEKVSFEKDQIEKKEKNEEAEEIWTETINTLEDLNLKKDLLIGINGYGFEKPSPIQTLAILPVIQNRDIIVQTQSGTGKTGCFVISLLQLIDCEVNKIQGLILCPTRELAQQICKVYQVIGKI